MHSRRKTIDLKSDRAFGLAFAVFFFIVSLLPLLRGAEIRIWSLMIASGFFITALVKPQLLAKPNQLWAKLGLQLEHFVVPVTMAIVFWLSVVPTAIVMRLAGKDLMHLRRDPSAESYWLVRSQHGEASTFRDQF